MTSLLKPKFDKQRFEETLQWEYGVYALRKKPHFIATRLSPEAILGDETTGALYSNYYDSTARYGEVRDIVVEYHRANSNLQKTRALQPASASSSATNNGPSAHGYWKLQQRKEQRKR